MVLLWAAMTGEASAHLQCVPYARRLSGIEIHGDARTWWQQAKGRYQRGSIPKAGAVIAFAATNAMPLGHVAVIDEVVDARHVLIDHANWSAPGMIEHRVLAEDVSSDGDWSLVRIFYAPIGGLGARSNPVRGFIYPNAENVSPAPSPIEIARADQPEAALRNVPGG
ncbi:CHAP domain-containing protein [Novosphingobium sp. BW1]|uniref:CHAP domain-containing protein n=1 Tax=Novosphingobium sp. BW1 TaxID=2592621 RepID=UPI0011DEBC0F|nr:CHAP domain-containing protein [Novosphingobium sp. BW1]TYC79100.1 CHAP domain-containing protein [Novosphingobium sp. BW1]